jgi:hypothetical protein
MADNGTLRLRNADKRLRHCLPTCHQHDQQAGGSHNEFRGKQHKKPLLLSNQEQIYAFKTNIPNNPHADFIIIIQKCHISDILNHNVKETHEICNRKKTIKDIVQKNTKECRLCVMLLWTKNVNLHHRKRKQDSEKKGWR